MGLPWPFIYGLRERALTAALHMRAASYRQRQTLENNFLFLVESARDVPCVFGEFVIQWHFAGCLIVYHYYSWWIGQC